MGSIIKVMLFKNYLFPVLLALSVCFTSCSNDDDTISTPEENFFALTVGNSWVYEHYQRENPVTAVYNSVGVIDSVKIVGTEIIDGNEFYKYQIRTSGNDTDNPFFGQNGERFEYRRDSLGYLISETGNILFAREDYQEFFVRRNASSRFWHDMWVTLLFLPSFLLLFLL